MMSPPVPGMTIVLGGNEGEDACALFTEFIDQIKRLAQIRIVESTIETEYKRLEKLSNVFIL